MGATEAMLRGVIPGISRALAALVAQLLGEIIDDV